MTSDNIAKTEKGFNLRRAFGQLDQILRGDATQVSSLSNGEINLPINNLIIVMVILGVLYGICLGSFNLLHPSAKGAVVTMQDAWLQLLASMVKFPLLFVLTLFITLPSLYVFNALVGSKLNFVSVLKLLVSSIAIMLTVLASLGPIVIFFSLCTTSYHFILLLNVVVCSVGGFLALAFLHRTLHRLMIAQQDLLPAVIETQVETQELTAQADYELPDTKKEQTNNLSALDRFGPNNKKAQNVIRIWSFVFALVGAQMSWVLRPFVGNPACHFELFRAKESNFFMAVLKSLETLFGG